MVCSLIELSSMSEPEQNMSRRWLLRTAVLGALAFLSGCGTDRRSKVSTHQMRTAASKNNKKFKLALRQSTVKRKESPALNKSKPQPTSKIKKAVGYKRPRKSSAT
jgi:hypothetical protein